MTQFSQADIDTRLSVLWFLSKRLYQTSKTAAPVALFSQVVQGLIQQVDQLSREDRIDALREIVAGSNTRLSEAYSDLNANMKLAFWYRLANNSFLSNLNLEKAVQVRDRGLCDRLLNDLAERDFNELANFLHRAVSVTGISVA